MGFFGFVGGALSAAFSPIESTKKAWDYVKNQGARDAIGFAFTADMRAEELGMTAKYGFNVGSYNGNLAKQNVEKLFSMSNNLAVRTSKESTGLSSILSGVTYRKGADFLSDHANWGGMKKFGGLLHNKVFAGAALGIGASYAGMIAQDILGDENIQHEGIIRAGLKGAALGATAGIGLEAYSGFSNAMRSDPIAQAALGAAREGNFGARMIGRATRWGTGKTAAAAVTIGAGIGLLSTIISTNLTRKENSNLFKV